MTTVDDTQSDLPSAAVKPDVDSSKEGKPSDSIADNASISERTQLDWVVSVVLLALLLVALIGWLLTYRKLKQAQLAGLTDSTKPRFNVTAALDEKAQYQRLMAVIKAKDTSSVPLTLKQWINALTAGKAQLSQFDGVNTAVNELYALRFSASQTDKRAQSEQVSKTLEKLTDEIKQARSKWQQTGAKNSHTLSNLYPAS